MKELDRIVLQKGLFASLKGHICLIKGLLDNPYSYTIPSTRSMNKKSRWVQVKDVKLRLLKNLFLRFK